MTTQPLSPSPTSRATQPGGTADGAGEDGRDGDAEADGHEHAEVAQLGGTMLPGGALDAEDRPDAVAQGPDPAQAGAAAARTRETRPVDGQRAGARRLDGDDAVRVARRP